MNGRPFDAPEFRPVWQTLADKGVPVLLHPARSSSAAVKNSACTEAEQSNIFTTNVERFFNLAPTS